MSTKIYFLHLALAQAFGLERILVYDKVFGMGTYIGSREWSLPGSTVRSFWCRRARSTFRADKKRNPLPSNKILRRSVKMSVLWSVDVKRLAA